MKTTINEAEKIRDAKKDLGKIIKSLRESIKPELSMRKLGIAIGLQPSNMKYIEDGVNAPTAEFYEKIIEKLEPDKDIKAEMDRLYTIIRGTPPPDVCKIITKNEGMNDALRLIKRNLSRQQMKQLKALLISFNSEV